MPTFRDLDDFFEITPIRLPIRGKTYEFPGSISGRTGLILHRLTGAVEQAKAAVDAGADEVELDATALDDVTEEQLRAEVLGEAEQQLLADDVPNAYIDHVFKTLLCWHQFGEDVARQVWEEPNGGPKAMLPQDHKTKATGPAARKASRGGTTRSRKASTGGRSSSTGA